MAMYETIDRDFKDAMRSKAEVRLGVLRMVRTAIKNKEKDLRRTLEDPEIMAVISSQVKQHKDSIEQFDKGGRPDLVEREQAELAILESYMPKQMDAAAIRSAVAALVKELGASSVKDTGKVMKEFMNRYAGQADGKMASEAVREILAG